MASFGATPVGGTYTVPSGLATGATITFSGSYSAGATYTWATTGPVAFGAGSPAALTVKPNHLGATQANVDLGAIINACDAALGSTPGDIVVDCGGGNIAKAVTVGAFHRLRLGGGIYTSTVGITAPNFSGAIWRLSSNSSIDGAGPQTILQESTGAERVNEIETA